jgi:hypothetical protein
VSSPDQPHIVAPPTNSKWHTINEETHVRLDAVLAWRYQQDGFMWVWMRELPDPLEIHCGQIEAKKFELALNKA